eukprot:m.45494 g.45494  ORF g.45494 m.45494 type:complete len:108 (+) comp17409_c0_seq4:2-325(+)
MPPMPPIPVGLKLTFKTGNIKIKKPPSIVVVDECDSQLSLYPYIYLVFCLCGLFSVRFGFRGMFMYCCCFFPSSSSNQACHHPSCPEAFLIIQVKRNIHHWFLLCRY